MSFTPIPWTAQSLLKVKLLKHVNWLKDGKVAHLLFLLVL